MKIVIYIQIYRFRSRNDLLMPPSNPHRPATAVACLFLCPLADALDFGSPAPGRTWYAQARYAS